MEKLRVLFVDDETNVLTAYQRQMRRIFEVEIAPGGAAGLELIEHQGPFAVVVADMRMPGMDGVEFLRQVKERAPDTVRLMLTGNADQETAVEAVNEGNIFRFLNKPCPPNRLRQAIEEAGRQYHLVIAERELLEKTLKGSVRVLTDVLSLVDPESFQFARRLSSRVGRMASDLGLKVDWKLEVAAMLSGIGAVTVPPDVVVRARRGEPLTSRETEVLRRAPRVAHDLLLNIPRLESVARILLYHEKRFDGEGFPDDDTKGVELPFESRLLKIALDLTRLETRGAERSKAVQEMSARDGWYDPELLDRVLDAWDWGGGGDAAGAGPRVSRVKVENLQLGMLLRSNVETVDGTLLITAGHEISRPVLERIRNFAQLNGIKEPIDVAISEDTAATVGASEMMKG